MPGRLKAEIGQERSATEWPRHFPSVETEAFLSLVRTASVLERDCELLVKAAGLTLPQLNVLRILRGAGREGATCGEIARRMIAVDPDLTRLLDRLRRRGWIERRRSARDRRAVVTRITAAGRELVGTLDEPLLALHRRQFAALGAKKLRRVLADLEALRAVSLQARR